MSTRGNITSAHWYAVILLGLGACGTSGGAGGGVYVGATTDAGTADGGPAATDAAAGDTTGSAGDASAANDAGSSGGGG